MENKYGRDYANEGKITLLSIRDKVFSETLNGIPRDRPTNNKGSPVFQLGMQSAENSKQQFCNKNNGRQLNEIKNRAVEWASLIPKTFD
jgi:hypothetical protein